jgi:ADP-ribose pyrophosphatase
MDRRTLRWEPGKPSARTGTHRRPGRGVLSRQAMRIRGRLLQGVVIRPSVWYSEVMRGTDGHLRWEERSRTHLASCRFFELSMSVRSSARGKTGEFCILSAPDWVNVVPVLRSPDGEERFLLVRQFRHGTNSVTTEFPAGLVEPGEDALHAASRELEEETGYRAGRMTLLGRISPNPAFMSNWCSTFLAEDLRRIGAPSLDETEDLEALEVPVTVFRQEVGRGEVINSLTVVAMHLFDRSRATAGGTAAP